MNIRSAAMFRCGCGAYLRLCLLGNWSTDFSPFRRIRLWQRNGLKSVLQFISGRMRFFENRPVRVKASPFSLKPTMTPSTKKQTRPATTPVPIRFTEKLMANIEDVASRFDLSRQDVIRLAVASRLESMRRLGAEGLIKTLSDHLSPPISNEERGSSSKS